MKQYIMPRLSTIVILSSIGTHAAMTKTTPGVCLLTVLPVEIWDYIFQYYLEFDDRESDPEAVERIKKYGNRALPNPIITAQSYICQRLS